MRLRLFESVRGVEFKRKIEFLVGSYGAIWALRSGLSPSLSCGFSYGLNFRVIDSALYWNAMICGVMPIPVTSSLIKAPLTSLGASSEEPAMVFSPSRSQRDSPDRSAPRTVLLW